MASTYMRSVQLKTPRWRPSPPAAAASALRQRWAFGFVYAHIRTFLEGEAARVEIRVCGGRELLGRCVALLNIAIAALLVLRVHRVLLHYRWHLCLAAEGCGEELAERGHLLVQMSRERTRESVDLVLAYLRRGRRRRSRMALLKRVQGRHPVLYLTESRELTQRRAIEGIYE